MPISEKLSTYSQLAVNFMATAALWIYFTLGFVILFSPAALIAYFCSADREKAFQLLVHLFFRLFFKILLFIAPRINIQISPEARSLRSSVVTANHISYLDPLLLIALYPRHKTIVKGKFFALPIFGHVIDACGYIPSSLYEAFTPAMIKRIQHIGAFLKTGGNLFIFPEGTRSLDGRVGHLNTSAFRIAKKHQAVVSVLQISHTNRLFPPKQWLFNVTQPITIQIELAGQIATVENGGSLSISKLINRARSLINRRNLEA